MPVRTVSSAEDFKAQTKSDFVAVFFSTPWCGPCKQFRPALEEISTRYSGVRFIEVDGTALPGVYTEMGAQETPFIVLMQGGQKVAGFGHISKSSVEKALERHGAESNVITAPPTVAETPDAVTETTVSAPGASGAAGGGGVTDVQSEAEFTRIVSENDYCVIDFYASWCGACKNFMPTYESIASAHGGTAKFLKVNVDNLEDIAAEMDVNGLPFIAFVKGGRKVDGFGHLTQKGVEAALAKNASVVAAAPTHASVRDTGVSSFEVTDAKSGNILAFRIEDGAIAYTVGGDARPSFKNAQSDGNSRLVFPETKKGCALPEKDLHIHLGNLKSLISKVGGETINFPTEVPLI